MQSVGGKRITGKLYDPFVRADRGRLYSQPLPTLQLPAWSEGLNEEESRKLCLSNVHGIRSSDNWGGLKREG